MTRRLKAAIVALFMAVALIAGVTYAQAYDPSDYNSGGCSNLSPLESAWWARRCWLPDPPPPMT